MAKVERPLFSDEATGKVGTVVSFKKGAIWNSIIPQFHRKKSTSASLRSQRNKYSAACAFWRSLSPAEKKPYFDNAPAGQNGFQYYLSIVLQ